MSAIGRDFVSPTVRINELVPKMPEPGDPRYTCFNDGGVECEVGEFLYGLIRMTRPEFVVETGTHRGIGAAYMGMALQANMFGRLETHEFLKPHFDYSTEFVHKLGINDVVAVKHGDVANVRYADNSIDLLFLDTEPQTRFGELIQFYNAVKPGGFILIHDLHPHMHQIENQEHGFAWPYGKLPDLIVEWINNDQLRTVHFRTPRGLTMFYKPANDDWR